MIILIAMFRSMWSNILWRFPLLQPHRPVSWCGSQGRVLLSSWDRRRTKIRRRVSQELRRRSQIRSWRSELIFV